MDELGIRFWITVSLAGLVFHGLAAATLYVLHAFAMSAFGRTPPSGPAALGRAFGLLFLFEVAGSSLLACLCPIVFQSWQPDAREVAEQALCLALLLVTPVLAASVADQQRRRTYAECMALFSVRAVHAHRDCAVRLH